MKTLRPRGLFSRRRVIRCGDALCPAIITFPIGVAVTVTTYGERWNAKRFRVAGIVSTAEIIAVRIREGGENPDVAELRVRISGPGFDTFEADCEVPAGIPRPRIGDRRQVVVDRSAPGRKSSRLPHPLRSRGPRR